jgi:hypothetical protein
MVTYFGNLSAEGVDDSTVLRRECRLDDDKRFGIECALQSESNGELLSGTTGSGRAANADEKEATEAVGVERAEGAAAMRNDGDPVG